MTIHIHQKEQHELLVDDPSTYYWECKCGNWQFGFNDTQCLVMLIDHFNDATNMGEALAISSQG